MKTTIDNKLQSVKGRLITFAVALAAVLADQLSKIAAVKGLVRVGESVGVIPGALSFTYVLNSGATAGMLSDKRWISWDGKRLSQELFRPDRSRLAGTDNRS